MEARTGVRIESKENPSKSERKWKRHAPCCFDIITDALTNARLRRRVSGKVGKKKKGKSWSTHETWLPSRQRKTSAQKN